MKRKILALTMAAVMALGLCACGGSTGGGVEDVMVRHRIYGKLSAQLSIHKQEDVSRFMEEIRLGKSVPLMNVTSGYHYHTVTAQDETTLAVIEAALREKKFLVDAKPIDVED